MITLMNKKVILGSLILGITLQVLGGCAISNIDELSTLKAMGSEDKEKDKVLSLEDKNFQKIKTAIQKQELKAGLLSSEVARKWGEPVVAAAEGQRQRWVYKEKKGDWFSGAKIYLYFSSRGHLERWQCIKTACEPAK